MSDTNVIRADYRLMRDIISTSFSKAGVSPTPSELDLVSHVFAKAGGTWERVFLGSFKDVTLLKKTIKVAIDSGRMTKSPKWGG
jgi:hypothetical protein